MELRKRAYEKVELQYNNAEDGPVEMLKKHDEETEVMLKLNQVSKI